MYTSRYIMIKHNRKKKQYAGDLLSSNSVRLNVTFVNSFTHFVSEVYVTRERWSRAPSFCRTPLQKRKHSHSHDFLGQNNSHVIFMTLLEYIFTPLWHSKA